MVELGEKQASPLNALENLAVALLPFDVRIDNTFPKEPSRPIAATENNLEKVQTSAVAILKGTL